MIKPSAQEKLKIFQGWIDISTSTQVGEHGRFTPDMMSKHLAKTLKRDPEDIRNIITLCFKEMKQLNKTQEAYLENLHDIVNEIPLLIGTIVNINDPTKAKKLLDLLGVTIDKYSDEDKPADAETINGLKASITSSETRQRLRDNEQLRKNMWAIARY